MKTMFDFTAGVLAQAGPVPDLLETFTSLGTAGVMAAMWLWERRTSRQREQQLDEAHARILSDRVALSELIDVVRQNAEAFSRFAATQPPSDGRTKGTT